MLRHSLLKNGYTLSVLLLLLAAFAFALQGLRVPDSDGFLRYQTFLSLYSTPDFSKYATTQPFMAWLIDAPVRFVFPGLALDFIPRHIEIFLWFVLVVIGVIYSDWRNKILLVSAFLPLSMMTHYFGQFFSETTTALLLAIAFVIFLRSNGFLGLLASGAIAGVALSNWSVLLICTFVTAMFKFGCVIFRKENDRRFLFFLAVSLLVGLVIVLFDAMIKGHLTSNPYASESEAGFRTVMPYSGLPGFSYPLILGMLGTLFSFGKSIFLFNPFLIFLIMRSYPYRRYVLVFLATAICIYSQWWAWYGGASFGTRFYIFTIVPSVFVLLHGLGEPARPLKYLEPFAFALAIWVAVSGKYFGLGVGFGVCIDNNYALEAFCWFVPEFSPLINPFVVYGASGVWMMLSWIDIAYMFACCALFAFMYLRSDQVTWFTLWPRLAQLGRVFRRP